MDTDFPYDAVVAEFQRVGKHFVRPAILAALAAERETASSELATFLDFTLDKYDGRYDNPSYIAIDLLPLPSTREELDRLVAILVADVLRHEREHGDDERLVAKRFRLGMRVLRRPVEAVEREFDDAEAERVRRRTVLPVSLVHDEYMFIRMLQCYEATFAFIAVKLREAIDAPETAAEAVAAAEQAMLAARPLWSMVATMRAEHFLAFREFTDGASAIQSRNYKLVESLCARPSQARLDSPAYRSVPEVRERVLAGQPSLGDVEPDPAARAAMERFEAALAHWRNSHYKLAMKMLGERRGTGYTEGVPYLNDVRSLPVFAAA